MILLEAEVTVECQADRLVHHLRCLIICMLTKFCVEVIVELLMIVELVRLLTFSYLIGRRALTRTTTGSRDRADSLVTTLVLLNVFEINKALSSLSQLHVESYFIIEALFEFVVKIEGLHIL